MNPNLRAFLQVVRACEGTAHPDGYRALFGWAPGRSEFLFGSFADHPRVRTYETHDEFIRNGKLDYTTAAGAYQITASTWDDFTSAVGPRDFSPANQDECAAWLIERAGAMSDVKVGDLETALSKCARTWASLPGSPYGQPTKSLAYCQAVFARAVDEEIAAPGTQPAAPIEERSTTVDPISLITIFGPVIANLIPQVAKLFDKKTETPEKIVAAQKVIETVVQSTGAVNVQEAVQKMQTEPAVLKAATVAVVSQPDIMAILEVGGGIVKAREHDIAQQAQEKPFWKTSAVFWISMMLLPMVYWYVGSSVVGGVLLPEGWPWYAQLPLKLFGTAWDSGAKVGLANLIVGLVLGGICGVYYGISVTQSKQQQQANNERQSP